MRGFQIATTSLNALYTSTKMYCELVLRHNTGRIFIISWNRQSYTYEFTLFDDHTYITRYKCTIEPFHQCTRTHTTCTGEYWNNRVRRPCIWLQSCTRIVFLFCFSATAIAAWCWWHLTLLFHVTTSVSPGMPRLPNLLSLFYFYQPATFSSHSQWMRRA